MSNPGQAATQTENDKSDETNHAKGETFSDKVDTAIASVTTDPDSKKQVFAEGTPDEVQYAANAELRRRETQSSFTTAKQELKQKDAELKTVKSLTKPVPKVELTGDQKEELDDLKITNPDAWRTKINAYEKEAELKADEVHQDNLAKGVQANEIERRSAILEIFNNDNPDIPNITDTILDNDVPPRYKQSLEAGKVTFEQFLDSVKTYLSQDKVIQKDDLENGQPNLNKVGGSSKPGQPAVEMDDKTAYENEIY